MHGESMELAKILKANPYHDEKGRFTSEANAKTISGNYKVWHGSAARDKLIEEGFILGKEGHGKGKDMLGPGMYVTPSKDYASAYGELVRVKTKKVKLARVTKEDLYEITQGKEFQAELRRRTDEFFSSPEGKDAFSAPNYKGQLIAEHFLRKGYHGVFSSLGPIPSLNGEYRTAVVLYDYRDAIESITKYSPKDASKEESSLDLDELSMFCIHPSILPRVPRIKRPVSSKKSAFTY